MAISDFIIDRIRSQLNEAERRMEDNGPCGYPRTVTLPWYAILWNHPGVGWMVRDVRDAQPCVGRLVK